MHLAKHSSIIDPHRVGLYNLLPLVGAGVAGASMNMQAPEKANAWRSLRDLLLMGPVAGLTGALAGGGLGAGIGAGIGALTSSPDGPGIGAGIGVVGGALGGSLLARYLGGRWRADARNREDPGRDKEKDTRLNSSLLAMLSPLTASSLMRREVGDVALRGGAGEIANAFLPFIGGGLAHYALHPKSEHKQASVPSTVMHPAVHCSVKLAAETTPSTWSQILKQLKGVSSDDVQQRMLHNFGSATTWGAGLGAAGGLGIQALRRMDQDSAKPKERPSLLTGLLLGGLLGGGAGAAAGIPYGLDAHRQLYNEQPLVGKLPGLDRIPLSVYLKALEPRTPQTP